MKTATALLAAILLAAAAGAGEEQEYGNYLSHRFRSPGSAKGSTQSTDPAGGLRSRFIRLAPQATACFDTGTLAYPGWWTGGFVSLSGTHNTSSKGTGDPALVGTLRFTQVDAPGWGVEGALFPDQRGSKGDPLPRELCRYRGLYLHGERTVLAYTVAGAEILELPGYDAGSDTFTRTVRIASSAKPLCMQLFQATEPGTAAGLTVRAGERSATVLTPPAGAALVWKDGKALLTIPPLSAAAQFTVVLAQGAARPAQAKAETTDLSTLTKGGPGGRWKPLTSAGVRGADDAAYVLDTLTTPENPWNTGFRFGGLDFLPDGRLALCTITGDVWLVSGVDASLAKLTWTRFATGLYEPLGLVVRDGDIFVRGRDQITRLHDLNGDGLADFYENFHNDDTCSVGYHAFAFELQCDSKGNFWYDRAAHKAWTPGSTNGAVIRVSADGTRTEVISNASKAANGMGIGPGDRVYLADNEDGGEGVPDSPIYFVRPGRSYGVKNAKEAGSPPVGPQDMPMLSLPKEADRSCGGQFFMGGGKFGPLDGLMFHTSYGNAMVYPLLEQEVAPGVRQAACYALALRYQTGVMRGRCGPDGQMYLCGQKGWDSNAAMVSGVHRVRYTGKPFAMPVAWNAGPNQMTITFAAPLDPANATAQNVAIVGGARSTTLTKAATWTISNVALSADGTKLTIGYGTPAASATCKLTARLKAKDGSDLPLALYFTIRSDR